MEQPSSSSSSLLTSHLLRTCRLATYWMRNMKAPDTKSLEAARRHVIGYGVAKDKWLAEAYAKTNKSAPVVMSEPCPPIICHVSRCG